MMFKSSFIEWYKGMARIMRIMHIFLQLYFPKGKLTEKFSFIKRKQKTKCNNA